MGQLITLHQGWINEKELDRIQQHEEEENPRLSCAHGHQGRQARPEPPAGQRAKKSHRLKQGKKAGENIALAVGFLPVFQNAWTDEHSAKMSGFGKKGIIWPSISRGCAAIHIISPLSRTGIHQEIDG